PSTLTLQPLLWPARRSTRPSVCGGTPPCCAAAHSAWIGCIASGMIIAGFCIRACILVLPVTWAGRRSPIHDRRVEMVFGVAKEGFDVGDLVVVVDQVGGRHRREHAEGEGPKGEHDRLPELPGRKGFERLDVTSAAARVP